MKAVTRFAPSPTGYIHIGNVRSAIYPYLIAKQQGEEGTFILRIEDTDQARYVEGATDLIKDTLTWLGLDWDEGPDIGGLYPPYIQSERTETYKDAAKKLIKQKKAYHCFCKYTDEHHGCVNDCYNLTPKEIDTRIMYLFVCAFV